MSLSALPTELDIAIIKHLNRSDLSHLSRCNKYFHQIAEPHLYENIHMGNNNDDRLKQLLITLINRKDLRRQIQSLGVHQGSYQPQPHVNCYHDKVSLTLDRDGPALYKNLLKNTTAIGAIIADVCSNHNLDAQLQMAMLSKVFEPYPLLDGALALIICMATRIHSLHLDFHLGQPLAMTRYLLESVDWRGSAVPNQEYPLMHIRAMCVGEGYCQATHAKLEWETFAIVPGLQELILGGNRRLSQISHARLRPTDSATLRHLKLRYVNFNPRMLQDMIQLPFTQNLETLTVIGLGRSGSDNLITRPWEHYDYESFKITLLKHLPHLKSFSWVNMTALLTGKGFGSFSGFPGLIKLEVDYHLMSNEVAWFTEPTLRPDTFSKVGYFPGSLKTFGLATVKWQNMSSLLRLLQQGGRLGEMPYLQRAMEVFIATLPVSQFSVTIDLGINQLLPKGDDPQIVMLLNMASTLHRLGTEFKVWYRWNGRWSLLVGPGHVALECFCYEELEP